MDYSRLAAGAGIIWFHTHAPGSIVAYAALPFFLVLLALPSKASVSVKAQRLLVPFGSWSLIYALVNIALAVKNDQAPLGWWTPDMLLFGTSIHLWFLPFAFLASLSCPSLRHPAAAPACAVLASLVFSLYGTPSGPPLEQWCSGLIPVLIGVTYFSGGWRLATATLLFASTIWYIGSPSTNLLAGAAGTLLALVVLSIKLGESSASHWCARVSKWMYLGHPLVMIVGYAIPLSGIALGAFTVAGSLILSHAMDTLLASRAGLRVRTAF